MSATAPRVSLALLVLLTLGCGPKWFLAGCDREIEEGTKAIGAAKDDGERALAHLQRAHGYAEKARYSKAFKLIETAEYERLFALAIADHDRRSSSLPTRLRSITAEGAATSTARSSRIRPTRNGSSLSRRPRPT
jgi:hypothetical protein